MLRRSTATLLLLLAGCADAGEPPLFTLVSPAQSGVDFVNEIPEDPRINILNYLYYYNGGGVAAGDVNGDDLPDLYFTSNLGQDRLYLNRGDMRFEDATARAGIAPAAGWTSGVTMADVNGDGHLDIYVSTVDYESLPGRNILYINNGDGTFADRAEEHGVAFSGYSTQALFADFDRDGDLDMYLLNQSTHEERARARGAGREVPHPRAGDRLFRNDGERFVEVTREAGIYSGVEGYGLGVVASDLDGDGCIDLYVANDFQENDFLYRNDCGGRFTESLGGAMAHTSRFSMGVDVADMNNDGLPDLFVADMLPRREEILKSSANAEPFNVSVMRLRAGYHPQYARNTLQLNRGGGRFSEIAFLAGVHATDWSWAPLFVDVDNDGWKDLLVTNGIVRRPNDLDYIEYVGSPAVQASLARGVTQENLSIIERMPRVEIANYLFRNNGDLTFEDRAEAWGLGQPGFSSGATWADLDNDGDLDLVISNINAPAGIYRNGARALGDAHYLRIRLEGEGRNTSGIGARVVIGHDGMIQMAEQVPTRGFQSSVDHRLHFGLGASTRVDSLLVVWPDGRVQRLADPPVDTVLTLRQAEATGSYLAPEMPRPLLRDVTSEVDVAFEHRENAFFDFNREPLMPHRVSTEGPALAVGDVDGNGLDDIFVGGAKWQAGRLLLQRDDARFEPGDDASFRADSLHEDVDAVFFDADGDGDLDLYVVSGGNEFWGEHEALLDRLYRNDGHGVFTRDRGALPALHENGGAVAAADVDGDGDVDLFVGGRVVARRYGETPRSALLLNDGRGRFGDATAELAPELAAVGMVTDAAWTRGSAGEPELVVVGEWMPVRVFGWEAGRLVERTATLGLGGTEGWWSRVEVADLDGRGAPDLVLGNLGLNSFIRGSHEEPVRMYVSDFAGNGSVQQLLTLYRDGTSYPFSGRDELLEAVPQLRERFPTYASFAGVVPEALFGRQALSSARMLEATTFASMVALRGEDGRFELRELPVEAQFAPVFASHATDVDGDGRVDLLLGGNLFGVAPLRGRYDASLGLLLRGSGDGHFGAQSPAKSGMAVDGEVRAIAPVRGAGGSLLLAVARSGGALLILRVEDTASGS